LPFVVEKLNHLGGGVDCVKPVFPIHGDSFRAAEFSGVISIGAHRADKLAVGVVDLNAITAHIAGIHRATAINGDGIGVQQFAGVGGGVCRVRDVEQWLPCRAFEDMDAVALYVSAI